jgi:hypothetical protein
VADVKLTGVQSNNGLLRTVRTHVLGPIVNVDISIEFADYFAVGKGDGYVDATLEWPFRSFDTACPLRAVYENLVTGEQVTGTAVLLPVFSRDKYLSLYYRHDGALSRLPSDWPGPGRRIRISGDVLVVGEDEEAPRVAAPYFAVA